MVSSNHCLGEKTLNKLERRENLPTTLLGLSLSKPAPIIDSNFRSKESLASLSIFSFYWNYNGRACHVICLYNWRECHVICRCCYFRWSCKTEIKFNKSLTTILRIQALINLVKEITDFSITKGLVISPCEIIFPSFCRSETI